MSLHRRLIVAVAALGLATSVFAADEATTSTTSTGTDNGATTTTTETTTPAATETTATAEKVDLNKANVKELMQLKGISAAKAKAIVSYRKKHGDFKSVDDLKEVKGFKKINEKKWQEISEQLTVG